MTQYYHLLPIDRVAGGNPSASQVPSPQTKNDDELLASETSRREVGLTFSHKRVHADRNRHFSAQRSAPRRVLVNEGAPARYNDILGLSVVPWSDRFRFRVWSDRCACNFNLEIAFYLLNPNLDQGTQ